MEPATASDVRNIRVAILRRARELIASRLETHICFALSKAAQEAPLRCPLAAAQTRVLRMWVEKMLAPNFSYGGGLVRHHEHLLEGLGDNQLAQRRLKGRLAWMDWMIEEVQK